MLSTAPTPDASGAMETPDVAALCREAGWPFEMRSDGSLAVDLGVAGGYVPAVVETTSDRVTLAAAIVGLPGAGLRRAALLALRSRVNRAFRIVRASLRGSGPDLVLDVELPRAAVADGLADAIAAMAVAARCCALEARLLAADEAAAREFLERAGSPPAP